MAQMRLVSGLIAGTAAVLAVCAASAQQPDAAPDPATGRATYIEYGCSQCHGTAAQGSLSAPSLAQGYGYRLILAKLRSKTGSMPRYPADILPDGKVAEIAAYLGNLPPPPAVEDIPAFRD